jgi:hypothetical protein
MSYGMGTTTVLLSVFVIAPASRSSGRKCSDTRFYQNTFFIMGELIDAMRNSSVAEGHCPPYPTESLVMNISDDNQRGLENEPSARH